MEQKRDEGHSKLVLNDGGKIEVVDPNPRALRATLTISLYADGDMQVDGPLDDVLLYKGMLAMAEDLGRDYAVNRRKQINAKLADAKKEPFWKRKMKEFKDRQTRKKSEAAAAAQNSTTAASTEADNKGGTPSPEVKAG